MPRHQKRMSPELIEAVLSEVEDGGKPSQLAPKIGFSPSAIEYHCVKNGILREGGRFQAVPEKEKVYLRNGRKVRRFTQAEDRLIEEMSQSKMSDYAIGKKQNRQTHTITRRLATLALRAEAKEKNNA